MHKHEQGINGGDDIVQVIKTELRECTEKFEFFIVESFGSTERLTKRDECPIKGMLKIHSLVNRRKCYSITMDM